MIAKLSDHRDCSEENNKSGMKTYLEIYVPISFDDSWFKQLRDALGRVVVRWQKGYYHITMAFLDVTPEDVNLIPFLEKHLKGMNAPTLTFDKLDVFTGSSGTHIIYLTATVIPKDFLSVIDSIREELKAVGCRIDSPFRLHVTLGRVPDRRIKLNMLQNRVESVALDAFSLTLDKVDYRKYKGTTIYETKLQGK